MLKHFVCLFLLIFSASIWAEQKQVLGDWDVHYMVVGTTFLTPEVAQGAGIVRSKFNALVNISVLDSATQKAQSLIVEGNARNLIGTTKALTFKEVQDGDAIYYLAVLPFRDQETYRFDITIRDHQTSQTLAFQQKIYVD
ncbi:DUF4426 domain-containing protein [Aestuariibacter salexigens]|uniref:DUF4426 domain-containing protein n=1 Tax=Aestuariibacter salexigens TaxID=226010 RepID=UPI00041F0BC6|nr:DUF4426 domain-containing protein [Aestuariibacter salexigens]